MKIYDNVKLNTKPEELASKGIHKGCGCTGIVLDLKANAYFIRFRNRKNRGDYACVYVDGRYLDYYNHESLRKLKTDIDFVIPVPHLEGIG